MGAHCIYNETKELATLLNELRLDGLRRSVSQILRVHTRTFLLSYPHLPTYVCRKSPQPCVDSIRCTRRKEKKSERSVRKSWSKHSHFPFSDLPKVEKAVDFIRRQGTTPYVSHQNYINRDVFAIADFSELEKKE